MKSILISYLLSRKSLLFLCLSVASVVFFPNQVKALEVSFDESTNTIHGTTTVFADYEVVILADDAHDGSEYRSTNAPISQPWVELNNDGTFQIKSSSSWNIDAEDGVPWIVFILDDTTPFPFSAYNTKTATGFASYINGSTTLDNYFYTEFDADTEQWVCIGSLGSTNTCVPPDPVELTNYYIVDSLQDYFPTSTSTTHTATSTGWILNTILQWSESATSTNEQFVAEIDSIIGTTMSSHATYRGTYPDDSVVVSSSNANFTVSTSSGTFIDRRFEGGVLNGAGNTPAGYDYWWQGCSGDNQTGNCFYITATKSAEGVWSGSLTPPSPPEPDFYDSLADGYDFSYQTRFLDLDATGTSTITFDVDYFIDPNEFDPTDSSRNPTTLNFSISKRPELTSSSYGFSIASTTGTSSKQVILDSTNYFPEDGIYDVLVKFGNAGCSIGLSACPFPNAYVYVTITISAGALQSYETPEFHDATQQEGDGSIFGSLYDFYLNILVNKHPFAWVYATIAEVRSQILEQQVAQDFSFDLNLVPSISTATSSEGYFNFYQYQDSMAGLNEYEFSPIERGCDALLTYDINCNLFKTLIGYFLWISLMLFYGLLLYKFVKPQNS